MAWFIYRFFDAHLFLFELARPSANPHIVIGAFVAYYMMLFCTLRISMQSSFMMMLALSDEEECRVSVGKTSTGACGIAFSAAVPPQSPSTRADNELGWCLYVVSRTGLWVDSVQTEAS